MPTQAEGKLQKKIAFAKRFKSLEENNEFQYLLGEIDKLENELFSNLKTCKPDDVMSYRERIVGLEFFKDSLMRILKDGEFSQRKLDQLGNYTDDNEIEMRD